MSKLKCKPVGEFVHCRIKSKERFDPRSFRTVSPNDDVRVTIGCPAGHWDARRELCKVSTQAQKIMYDRDVCSGYKVCREGRKR